MRKNTHYYQYERRKGRLYSAALHFVFLLFVIFGLPQFLAPPPLDEPMVISVDILPVTGITNVKPSEKTPEKENKPDEKQSEQKKPSPPVKTAENTPPPPPEEAPAEKPKDKAEDIKKEEKKKEEKKKKEKKKPKEDPLAAILKAVKETAQKERKEKPKEDKQEEDTSPTRSMSNQYNPALPMSMSEKDAIMSQLARCWNVPAGAKDAQNLVVVLNAEYNVDGSYIRVELARESMLRYSTDSFFRAAADAAIRAVKECSPLKDLPPQKYNTWRVMELRFDPQFMLN